MVFYNNMRLYVYFPGNCTPDIIRGVICTYLAGVKQVAVCAGAAAAVVDAATVTCEMT